MSRIALLRVMVAMSAAGPACAATPADAGAPGDGARIAIWHDAPVPGGVRVYVDSAYAGTLRQYVERGPPACASRGTLTVRVGAGAVVVVDAEASDGRRWRREVRANAGRCTVLLLPSRRPTGGV